MTAPKKKPGSSLIPSWFRRVVPQGYAVGTITFTGTAPLLMNCPDADREGDLYQAFTQLSRKAGKTPDDEARLAELEWEVRVYLDPVIGPYIPGRIVKGVLNAAAGKYRKGATINRSLITMESRIPLEYEGPRDQSGLWADGYRYMTMIKNAGLNGGRVMRCRPMFPKWSLTADWQGMLGSGLVGSGRARQGQAGQGSPWQGLARFRRGSPWQGTARGGSVSLRGGGSSSCFRDPGPVTMRRYRQGMRKESRG